MTVTGNLRDIAKPSVILTLREDLTTETIERIAAIEAEEQARITADGGKLDKITGGEALRAYVTNGSDQYSLNVSDAGEGGAIPRYRANGTLHVEDPGGATDAASKGYVDGVLENAVEGLETDIASEASARSSADTALQGDITAEASTRAAADSTLQGNINLKAPLASPAFSGVPTVPTAAAGTSTTQAASTAFVGAAVAVEKNARISGDNDLQTQIDAMGGQTRRFFIDFEVEFSTATPTKAQTDAWLAARVPALTPNVGTAFKNNNTAQATYNHLFVYYTDPSDPDELILSDDGVDTVSTASATSLGIVRGAGNVSVDINGDMHVELPAAFPEAPIDGETYGRKDGDWTEIVTSVAGQVGDVRSVVHEGICTTAGATVDKVCTMDGYTLTAGDLLSITYTNGNTANAPTLNINGSGAKNILMGGRTLTGAAGSGAAYCSTGGRALYYYDGSVFNQMGSMDVTDDDTTSVYNMWLPAQSFKVDPDTQETGGGLQYALIGLTSPSTVEKVTMTSDSAAGARTFTTLPLGLFDPILRISLLSGSWTAEAALNAALYLSSNVGTANWKYPIGQYYDKSGTLQGNNVTTDLVQTPLYVGGTLSGEDKFVPSEYSLTLRDTSKVYKQIGQFATSGNFTLTFQQPVYKYEGGTWAEPSRGSVQQQGWYGVCSTAGATEAKTVDIAGFTAANFTPGTRVTVKFNDNNSASSMTLNVNGLGAKETYDSVFNRLDKYSILAGQYITFVLDANLKWIAQNAAATAANIGLIKDSSSSTLTYGRRNGSWTEVPTKDEFNEVKNAIYSQVEIYINKTVEPEEWAEDGLYPSFYPYAASISDGGIDADMVPVVTFGIADAISGNFAPIAESGSGKVTIRAAAVPAYSIMIPTILCIKEVS
jgi:hypothetical protein